MVRVFFLATLPGAEKSESKISEFGLLFALLYLKPALKWETNQGNLLFRLSE